MPPTSRKSARLLMALLSCLILSSLLTASAAADTRPWPRTCPDSNRFGVAIPGGNITDYDVGQLHAGWYHSFTIAAVPPHPAGMGFVQTIRLADDGPFADKACSTCPPWTQLQGLAQGNPGSLWLIGNEPDRQDYITPGRYTELYHTFYYFLKDADPTCQVAIGGVVQTTPLRLDFLDLILDAYQNNYGRQMPVDVWNVHHYLLREANDWGGGMPPGADPSLAIHYDLHEHDMLNPHPDEPEKLGWKEHLVEMRRWMRDRGYRDRPLIITEYGILMPEIYGYDYKRVSEFMRDTFDWMMSAKDPNLGFPADDNRLVQAWAWYSLDDPAFEDFTSWNHLFEPSNRALTKLGANFGAYTSSLTWPAIDLQLSNLLHSLPVPEPDGQASMTITATIYNGGAATAQNVQVRFRRDGVTRDQVTVPSLSAGQSVDIQVLWTDLTRDRLYDLTVIVDPNDQIDECDPLNNELAAHLLVADLRVYLPVIQKDF